MYSWWISIYVNEIDLAWCNQKRGIWQCRNRIATSDYVNGLRCYQMIKWCISCNMVCIGRTAIFKWHEHHGKFMVFPVWMRKNRYDWEFWYIGYNTNHHQWRGSSNSSLDLSNMISVYFAIHKAYMRYPRSCVQLLNQIPGFHGKDLITWISGWTTCLSCHFCSFFSNTLGGHTCSCSWHSAYEKSYSHVAMSCGCSWDLSNSETLCSHAWNPLQPCMWPVYINYTESPL